MNQKQSWEEELLKECACIPAFKDRGMIDSNCFTHKVIESGLVEQAIQTREREISEEVEKIDGQDRLYEGREFVDVDVVLSIVGGKKYEDLC